MAFKIPKVSQIVPDIIIEDEVEEPKCINNSLID